MVEVGPLVPELAGLGGVLVGYARLVLPYLWGLLLAYLLAQPLADSSNRRYCISVYRRLRPGHLLTNLGIVALTIYVYALLCRAAPILHYSWLSAFTGPGSDGGAGGGVNLLVVPVFLPVIGPAFAALSVFTLPLLTKTEERIFRGGTRSMVHAVPKSLLFGLAHCLVGVPLAAGLALTVPGLWFSHRYLTARRRGRDGVEASAIHHTAYNAIVVATVGSLLVLAVLV